MWTLAVTLLSNHSTPTHKKPGTNTDGVLIDITKTSDPLSRGVMAFCKHETTVDVTDGIETVVRNVLVDANVDPKDGRVLSLSVGTTVRSPCHPSLLMTLESWRTIQHFINAIIQSDVRCLSRVAVIRLAAPYSVDCPPVRMCSVCPLFLSTIHLNGVSYTVHRLPIQLEEDHARTYCCDQGRTPDVCRSPGIRNSLIECFTFHQ